MCVLHVCKISCVAHIRVRGGRRYLCMRLLFSSWSLIWFAMWDPTWDLCDCCEEPCSENICVYVLLPRIHLHLYQQRIFHTFFLKYSVSLVFFICAAFTTGHYSTYSCISLQIKHECWREKLVICSRHASLRVDSFSLISEDCLVEKGTSLSSICNVIIVFFSSVFHIIKPLRIRLRELLSSPIS